MTIKGPHEWLRLEVIWPESDTDAGDHVDAVSPDVFAEFAGDEQNIVTLERVVGGIVLRKGDVLEAHGNTKAHNGDELKSSLTDVMLLSD